jgi:hypothetical protein
VVSNICTKPIRWQLFVASRAAVGVTVPAWDGNKPAPSQLPNNMVRLPFYLSFFGSFSTSYFFDSSVPRVAAMIAEKNSADDNAFTLF